MSFFITVWDSGDRNWYDQDLGYLSVVQAHQRAAAFIEEHYSTASIIAAFPDVKYLTDASLGYVRQPLKYVQGPRRAFRQNKEGAPGTVIVISQFFKEWTKGGRQLDAFLRHKSTKPLATFTAEGKEVVSIYSF